MKSRISVYNIAIAIILILILIIGSMMIFMNPAKKTSHKPMKIADEQPATPAKPAFRKDGRLNFIDAKTNKVITTIDIEVADDDAERAQGMMFRDSMADDNGMLFMMEIEEPQAFWMKNTILPLDILFADSERRIVSIHKNTKPYSLDLIESGRPAIYVVEVNAGFTEKFGIRVGNMISF